MAAASEYFEVPPDDATDVELRDYVSRFLEGREPS
jgi:hypothetical protein